MRHYHQIMTQVMALNYDPGERCSCSQDFGFDPYAEEDLCDLCRTRLRRERRKVNRRLRLQAQRRRTGKIGPPLVGG